MKILKGSRPYPNLRFRTEEDARKAMESLKFRKQIDPSLVVLPWLFEGDNVVLNQEYLDAPYELSLVEFEPGDNEVVDCEQPTPDKR